LLGTAGPELSAPALAFRRTLSARVDPALVPVGDLPAALALRLSGDPGARLAAAMRSRASGGTLSVVLERPSAAPCLPRASSGFSVEGGVSS
jgi:hypothetical protein